jgi:asparagine synthase (glutamine-hydrolysing)
VTGDLFAADLAGVHDLRGDVRADDALRRALPGGDRLTDGPLALGGGSAGAAGDVHVRVAGRIDRAAGLRAALGLAPTTPVADTVAAGYARWGAAVLGHVSGPFALVAWDRAARRGLLAQDQLGGRSLFTFEDGPRLWFATEVAVLLRLLPRRPGPDELALAYHLVDHSIPDGRMLYRGVSRLGAGASLELSDAGRVARRHWAPRHAPPLRAPRPELAAGLRDALTAAAAHAAPAAATGAVLLSGGLDSSAVASLAAPRAPGLRAVSAAFPRAPDVDETAWAAMVAERARLALTSVPIEAPDPVAAAEAYGNAWALPLPAPGIVIEAPLIAAARTAGATVALDGQGGDEVLGPAYFVIADRLRRGRALAAYKLARRYPGIGPAPTRAAVRLVLTGVGVRGAVAPRLHERIRGRRPTGRYAPAWLRPGPAALFVASEDPWRWKRLDGPRWWAALADTLTRGRERADIADYVRRRARLGGLEGRSPLLDLGLVEFVLRIPPETNFDPVTSRPLAREALRGTLPEAVLARRDKSDFAAFYHRLLAAEATLGRIRDLLDPRRAGVGAYVDLVQVHRDLLDRPPPVGGPGWRAWAPQIWNIATGELWLRSQAD